ncbi:MAG: MFS transporter [Chloroflexi bacterium]|nr:MFS transporter [Chloroflexota bacterium]
MSQTTGTLLSSGENAGDNPGSADARARYRTLIIVSVASLFGLSVWFSTNAISAALEAEKGLGEQDVAWLTIAVQLGFVFGTVVIALTNIADLLNARTLFFISAIGAGLLNLLVIPADNLPLLILVRFGTGAFLGGVYPPAMKVLSGWFNRGRGFALGMMIGALTLGSGSPHLLRSIFVDNWEAVIIGSSFLAFAGGTAMRALVRDGPFEAPAAKFRPASMLTLFTERGLRLTLIGYLGHMWELYAMWAWIGAFMVYLVGTRPIIGDSLDLASTLTFGVFFAGAVASPLAGILAERIGRTAVTSLAMVLSGGMALMIGFLPDELAPLIVVVAMIWGATVVADSAQFSTAVTELAPPEYRGTILTFQTGLGFLLTAGSIWLVPVLQEATGWGVAFAALAAGPVIGTIAMLRLKRLPEARRLAGGRG